VFLKYSYDLMAVSKKKKDVLVPKRRSVHVVFFSCPHCGEEVDYINICPECGEPMKVIDVVEKFGEDADRFLERAKKRLNEQNCKSSNEDGDFDGIDKEEPNIILMGDENLEDDEGIDPSEEIAGIDDGSLDVIFPEDEDEDTVSKVVVSPDDDLAKALEQLDSEEDEDISAEDFGFEDGEIPEL
jgi:hypothetical protein